MDITNFNAAEQAHMQKIIETKQVRLPLVIALSGDRAHPSMSDARLHEDVRWDRRAMLHLVLQ